MAKTPVLAPKVTMDWAPFPSPGEVFAEVVEEVVVEDVVEVTELDD
jgi:hypothetical protein